MNEKPTSLGGRVVRLALVLAAFHFEESLVEAEKGEAERE